MNPNLEHSPSSHESSSSGDETPTMGKNNQNRSRLPKRAELDLSAVINVEQKFQLQRLITAILDDMQNQTHEIHDNLTPAQVASGQGIKPPSATCLTIPNPRSDKYRDVYIYADQDKPTKPDTKKEDVRPVFQPGNAAGTQTKKENLKPGSKGGKATDPKTKKELTKAAAVAEKAPQVEKSIWKAPKSPEEANLMYGGKTDKELLVNSVAELKKDIHANFGKWRTNVVRRVQDIIVKNGGTGGNVGGRPILPVGPSENPVTVFAQLYPPIPNPLREAPKEKRALILHSMLLILLGLDQYAVYSRILLVRLSSSLNIPYSVLQRDELRVARALSKIIKGIPVEDIIQQRAQEARARHWRPGMAANAAVTENPNPGTLSPHLKAAGVGTVFGGVGLTGNATAVLLASMNESTVVVGTLFGVYGARQGTKTMAQYGKDIQGFGMVLLRGSGEAELNDPKDVPTDDRKMRVTIGITGFMSSPDDLVKSWQILGPESESYALRWEEEGLVKMMTSMETLVKSPTWARVKKEITSQTVYDRLTQIVWPIGLLRASKIIETPWCAGVVRADKAGAALADMLINRSFGERPVSLIGYSLGARIIYQCIMTLAEKRAFGLVENVIMMGTPCPSEVRVWAALRTAVGGRLINVYSKQDYLLGFLSRNHCYNYGVAGLQAVEGVPHVENFDASEIVNIHLRYRYLVGSILKKVGWEDIDHAKIAAEQHKLKDYIKELDEAFEKGNNTEFSDGAHMGE